MKDRRFDFGDWGSLGVGDFYKGNDDALREAIDGGENFDTGWHGFEKELQSMRIQRTDDKIVVSVGAYMDEVFDGNGLIYDCLEESEEEKLTDEMVEQIREALACSDFVEMTSDDENLAADASFDDVMKSASELMDGCEQRLEDSFRQCITATLLVMYPAKENLMEFIDQRIAKLAPYKVVKKDDNQHG